jgi:predicted permease
MREAPRRFRVATWVYRACLRLAPSAFRRRFGDEAASALEDFLSDERAARGRWAAVWAAAAACADVTRAGLRERLAEWRRPGAGLGGDLVSALRVYRREPILAAAITATLALAVGPAVAVDNALYQLVLAPLPYREPARLVVIAHESPAGLNTFSTAASVDDYRAVQAFSSVGGIAPFSSVVSLDGVTARMSTWQTTGGLLSDLGVRFAAGRDFTRGEPAAVVTRAFALAHAGSEGAALGRSMVVDGLPVTIVGVLADMPVLPRPGVDLFVPHPNADAVEPSRGGRNTMVIARLRDGVSKPVAEARSRAIAAAIPGHSAERQPRLLPLDEVTRGGLVLPMTILFAAATALFLIAVSSVSSLVLARAVRRTPEIAVRLSLGASRWRIVRAWLVDGAVLAWPGIALGAWLSPWLVRYAQSRIPVQLLPLPDRTALPVIAVAVGAALAAATLFAFAPLSAGVLRVSLAYLRRASHQVARSGGGPWQSMLIAGQVAIGVLLFTGTVWLALGLHTLLTRPLGFDPDALVVVGIQSARDRADQLRVTHDLAARLAADDKGSMAAVTSSVPGLGASNIVPFRVRPDEPLNTPLDRRPRLAAYAVSADYFRVMGIPVIAGRAFSAEDDARPGGVIVVGHSFAARWFPDGALGRTVSFGRDDRRIIIGVADDVHAGTVIQDSAPQYYVPIGDTTSIGRPAFVVLRTARPVAAVRADVTAMFKAADPAATVMVTPAADAMALPLASERLADELLAALAAMALLLAVVNVYALAAGAVAQRAREIGIRLALGATPRHAVGLVMRRGMTWTITGVMLGIVGATLVGRPAVRHAIAAMHPGGDSDVVIAAGTAVALVAATAWIATWLPARRAARIDPVMTLRAE